MNDTDRELLELAAKAAGIDLQHRPMFGGDAEPGYYVGNPPNWQWWNPLTDDGDALRLAVKLGIDIQHYDGGIDAGVNLEIAELYGSDSYAATRRAVVRAAAGIWRAK